MIEGLIIDVVVVIDVGVDDGGGGGELAVIDVVLLATFVASVNKLIKSSRLQTIPSSWLPDRLVLAEPVREFDDNLRPSPSPSPGPGLVEADKLSSPSPRGPEDEPVDRLRSEDNLFFSTFHSDAALLLPDLVRTIPEVVSLFSDNIAPSG